MMKNPDEPRTLALTLRELAFVNELLSRRGGPHPCDTKRWRDTGVAVHEKVLNAFADAPVPTCRLGDATLASQSATCDGPISTLRARAPRENETIKAPTGDTDGEG